MLDPRTVGKLYEVHPREEKEFAHELHGATQLVEAGRLVLLGGHIIDVMYDGERQEDVRDGVTEIGKVADPAIIPHLGCHETVGKLQLLDPADVRLHGLRPDDLVLRALDALCAIADAHRTFDTENEALRIADGGLQREEATAAAQIDEREGPLAKGALKLLVDACPSGDEVLPRSVDVCEIGIREVDPQPRCRFDPNRARNPNAPAAGTACASGRVDVSVGAAGPAECHLPGSNRPAHSGRRRLHHGRHDFRDFFWRLTPPTGSR
mmetsp:Transcript_6886/g.17230  ORF Transcript_6886/g.17230 Transcript_6886/m.17230 type:complete len:266 (-) Transcript_6886:534-1331(-)